MSKAHDPWAVACAKRGRTASEFVYDKAWKRAEVLPFVPGQVMRGLRELGVEPKPWRGESS